MGNLNSSSCRGTSDGGSARDNHEDNSSLDPCAEVNVPEEQPVTVSAGSGAPARSGEDDLANLGDPIESNGPSQAAASVESGVPPESEQIVEMQCDPKWSHLKDDNTNMSEESTYM